jgi:hypothetical protein
MRGALAKARRARVLSRTAGALDAAYERALAARASAEHTTAWAVILGLVLLCGGRRAAALRVHAIRRAISASLTTCAPER